ncbi:kinesin motor protein cin8 [Pleurotus ostreatus]|uniref:Kinesin motor protein cin8 n=1 Tax=Pleurotus ostreatus TaxID=5322 RepID=A0A8H7A1Y4_PLEOS|nr:kinesin motor protein cin8 [Pleurotus ostreatus]KAF7440518.1 kinesin motor protein cin8 [Pleurotus ostreatus]
MATRRPPSSRSTKPPPQPIQRSRSALAKPASRPSPPDDGLEASGSRLGQRNEDSETNIQVVVRCRRRSEREVQDNSPIIVSSSGAKSKDVSIETSAPISSLGVVTLPPLRTYPFDVVFGPEADQALIYHEVVSPMLEEVLMGYNCTLFAYGQTGTGKTYTMQGDLTPTPMGNPSAHAGMIPRVLFRLFHQLETSTADYSVKISYIELYNEELRDLLANEPPPSAGSSQTMGVASNSKTPNDIGLKIFDDASKRGVVIQGLEEISVKDSKDALALLTKGSQRRQIAATKFNDHSSRSHSVFSVTVHIKETSSMGDDLLKVGKLNLVDLAGSENIGRSGAENKRAREAGMINQSLLTLGRVINALVDRSSHVPYRESKLTRLLQDSLGGRTKTCIIATISPARSNMEETLSTLDYALRAKSIRNKPEVNQRMTRNSLLKEYVAEIERLKADLLAAREKNGIFFSEETWEEMSKEQEMTRTEREEALKQVEVVEAQLRAVREEFEQSIALLMRRDEELKKTRAKLHGTEQVLQVKEGELKVVKVALEEEVVVREAFQATEGTLDQVAHGLKDVVQQTVSDVGGLFDKLDRKTSVLKSNTKAVTSHGQLIASASNALSDQLKNFISSSTQRISQLQTDAGQLENRELELLSSYSARIDKQLGQLHNVLASIRAKDSAEGDVIRNIQHSLTHANETFKTHIDGATEEFHRNCEDICGEVQAKGIACFSQLEMTVQTLGTLFDTVVHEAQEYVSAERTNLSELTDLTNQTIKAECSRLQTQNAMLGQMLKKEQAQTQQAKEELVQLFSSMLSDFISKRQTITQSIVSKAIEGNGVTSEAMEAFGTGTHAVITSMDRRGNSLGGSLRSLAAEGQQVRSGTLKARRMLGRYVVPTLIVFLLLMYFSGFEQYSRVKRARLDSTAAMGTEVQSTFKTLQSGLASTSRGLGSMLGQMSTNLSVLDDSVLAFHSAAASQFSSQQKAIVALIQEGSREDTPTGSTPRKRKWVYDDSWDLTKSRSEILSSWRKHATPEASSDTFVARHLPIPEDADEPLDDEIENSEPTVRLTDFGVPDPEGTPGPSSAIPSLSSSVSSLPSSSTSSPPEPLPLIRDKAIAAPKQNVPPTGTLITSRTSNIATRSRRRR